MNKKPQWVSVMCLLACLLVSGLWLETMYASTTIESAECVPVADNCGGVSVPAPFSGCVGRPEASCQGTTCYNCDGSWEELHWACVTTYSTVYAGCEATGNPLICGSLWQRSCYWYDEVNQCACRTSGGTKQGACTYIECTPY